MENGDSNSQSAGFELLRRSCAGRCQRPWSPPCRARHEAAPEKGPGGSTFRASGGTGLLLNASLQRAWTDGLLTERRRCSLTRRSERQAELEIYIPLLKSARGGRCTRADWTGCAQSRGVGQTPRTRGPHCALSGSPQLPPSFSWCSGAGLFTGKSREQERTRRLTSKPTGTTWLQGAGSVSRPALRSCEMGTPGPAPGRTWGGLGLRASSSHEGA